MRRTTLARKIKHSIASLATAMLMNCAGAQDKPTTEPHPPQAEMGVLHDGLRSEVLKCLLSSDVYSPKVQEIVKEHEEEGSLFVGYKLEKGQKYLFLALDNNKNGIFDITSEYPVDDIVTLSESTRHEDGYKEFVDNRCTKLISIGRLLAAEQKREEQKKKEKAKKRIQKQKPKRSEFKRVDSLESKVEAKTRKRQSIIAKTKKSVMKRIKKPYTYHQTDDDSSIRRGTLQIGPYTNQKRYHLRESMEALAIGIEKESGTKKERLTQILDALRQEHGELPEVGRVNELRLGYVIGKETFVYLYKDANNNNLDDDNQVIAVYDNPAKGPKNSTCDTTHSPCRHADVVLKQFILLQADIVDPDSKADFTSALSTIKEIKPSLTKETQCELYGSALSTAARKYDNDTILTVLSKANARCTTTKDVYDKTTTALDVASWQTRHENVPANDQNILRYVRLADVILPLTNQGNYEDVRNALYLDAMGFVGFQQTIVTLAQRQGKVQDPVAKEAACKVVYSRMKNEELRQEAATELGCNQ